MKLPGETIRVDAADLRLRDAAGRPVDRQTCARVANLLSRKTVRGVFLDMLRTRTLPELEAQTFAFEWTPINGPTGLAGYVLQWFLDRDQWRITAHTYQDGVLHLLTDEAHDRHTHIAPADAVRIFESALG